MQVVEENQQSVLERGGAVPVVVVEDEVGGAEGALVGNVGQKGCVGRQLDHLRVALHPRHERCLRHRTLCTPQGDEHIH